MTKIIYLIRKEAVLIVHFVTSFYSQIDKLHITAVKRTFFNVEFTISFTKSYFLIKKKNVAKKTHYIEV